MATEDHHDVPAERAALESITSLLSSANEQVLQTLIENPALDEAHVCVLLERKDLPVTLLEEISKRKTWRSSYRVRRALVAHAHTPRLIAIRMLRDLHLMDLVQISLLPTSSGELRRLAEERVLAQIPQAPLGQRLTLARRASSRILGALIAQGPIQVARIALDNAVLSESQLLKTLAGEALPSRIVATVAKHEKWSRLVNVRMAVVRHPHAPPECLATVLANVSRRDIEELLGLSQLREGVRVLLHQELARRGKE